MKDVSDDDARAAAVIIAAAEERTRTFLDALAAVPLADAENAIEATATYLTTDLVPQLARAVGDAFPCSHGSTEEITPCSIDRAYSLIIAGLVTEFYRAHAERASNDN